MVRALVVVLAAAVPLLDVLFAQPPVPPSPKGRKVAFLVGVGEFKHGPRALGIAPKRDVTKLAEVLAGGGFEVVTLTDAEATKDEIEKRYKALLDGGGNSAKALGNKDVLLVSLCTHGFMFDVERDGKKEAEPFVAGHDAKLKDRGTMVSLNAMLKQAEAFAPTTLFLVDACREDANRSRGIEGKRVNLPERTAILFACGAGQLSHQDEKLGGGGHGLFTYAVLDALRQDRDDVSWADVVAGVQRSFRSPKFKDMIPAGRVQEPVLATGELSDVQLLVRTEPPAGKEIEVEIETGVKMRFCWVPPSRGKVLLGSPKGELDRQTDEGDREFETNGFWLGKYEVTQGEWRAVIGTSPSAFAATGTVELYRKRVVGMDTSRFPVEQVSWDDICGKGGEGGAGSFLGAVNTRGVRAAFGQAGRFVLPTEDEWEYAARGGHKDRRPFHWGSTLNGTEANGFGKSPYGTSAHGPYLERPTVVGSYERKVPHPWGLCDMHGNVWEWCENTFAPSSESRAERGGSYGDATSCRAACRYGQRPDTRHTVGGFRLCFRPD